MAKLIGYILALIGLAVILLSFNISRFPSLVSFNKTYIMIAGVILVILGVVFTIGKGKIKQSSEEVPIYEGTGKKRKIVGYRKS